MKRLIRASEFSEDEILDLLDEAVSILKNECDTRGKDEYVDDIKWGSDRFEIPIFISPDPMHTEEVAEFLFVYDPDEEESINEQMHIQLDEFLNDWNADEEESSYTGDDFIEDAIDEVTFECLEKYRKSKTTEQIAKMIKDKLAKKPYNLKEGEDFTEDDVSEVMNDYRYYWD